MAARSRRRRLLVAVLLLGGGGAAWYLRSRLTEVREPWSSVPTPGEPGAPGDPEPPSPSLVSAAWADTPQAPPDPEPSPVPRVAPDDEPRSLFTPVDTVSSGMPAEADGAAPGPEYTIKGTADSMLFHTPDSPYYKRTWAEVWFRDADEARAAGFTEWLPKRRAAQ